MKNSFSPAETPRADEVAPHLNLSNNDMRDCAWKLRALARQLERERNAWEAKFNAECEKHDATTLRAMKAERELAETNKRDSRNFARMVEQGLRADRAERALRIAQSTNPASISKEAAAFLLGEGPLDGVWFGDPHPKYPGNFWWRAFLRQEVSR